jgi:hypothetical protein
MGSAPSSQQPQIQSVLLVFCVLLRVYVYSSQNTTLPFSLSPLCRSLPLLSSRESYRRLFEESQVREVQRLFDSLNSVRLQPSCLQLDFSSFSGVGQAITTTCNH